MTRSSFSLAVSCPGFKYRLDKHLLFHIFKPYKEAFVSDNIVFTIRFLHCILLFVCWYFLVPNTLVVELIMHFSALLEDNCLENIWSLSVNASDVFSGCLAACLNLQKLLTQNVHNLCDLSLARRNKIKKTVENWKSQFRGQMGWNEWNIIVKLTLWC